jgi:hypothetical protein
LAIRWQYSCVEKVGTGCACAAMDETAIARGTSPLRKLSMANSQLPA